MCIRDRYNVTDAKLSVAGVGAYIGLPKAYNGGEMADLAGNLLIDPNTITERTYTYRMLDENTLMVSMDWGEGYWITFLGRVGMSGAAGESVARMDPYEAFSDEPVTIYFDLNLGNQRLAGYQGDIYVHTGVQTNLNDLEAEFPYDFSYQIGEYGDNDVNPKLEMVAENYYKLDIPTSIREFYGVPDDEEIYNLVFVLRSQDTFRAEDGVEFFIMQGEYDGAAILVGVNTEDDQDDFGGRLNLSGVQNIKTIYNANKSHIDENDFEGYVDFGYSGIYFKPLVNAKAKFIDLDNDGLPELIYAGSTSSTSIGVAAVYVYFFDNFNGGLQALSLIHISEPTRPY